MNVIQKRAIDVTPHNHALWCSVEGLNKDEPFANTIEYRSWGKDGSCILFGLDTHNSFSEAAPDGVVPWRPNIREAPAWGRRQVFNKENPNEAHVCRSLGSNVVGRLWFPKSH